jgi:dGTPase
MNWEQLLSLRRHGDAHKRLRREQDETRLGFEVDYDRVLFSAAFRSLQDKTQVVPLSQTDFVHTRLTHSLEVSVVGRSLGRQVGTPLLQRHPHLEKVHGYRFNDFGAIIAAASLAHDIGNPPFGHSGEKAIGSFFKTGEGAVFASELSAEQYQDLCDFEGNANGFRILTESRMGMAGGLRLSYATLGAFMKYPKESLPKKPSNHIADKKYGFFQSEKNIFSEVADELGLLRRSEEHLSYCRHPLTYLVEAADDICYTVIDFEDGINLGLIPEEFALEYLIQLVRDRINSKKYQNLVTTQDRIAYLRALAISTLIDEAVHIFMANEALILKDAFPTALLEKSQYAAQIEDIIKLSVSNIYQSDEVVNKEIAGYKVLHGLISEYSRMAHNAFRDKLTNFDKLLLKSMPDSVVIGTESLYSNLLAVCSYVASLSDSRAMQIYHRLQGASF